MRDVNDDEKQDEEKRKLIEATKQVLMNTTTSLGSVKSEHMAMKDSIQAMKDLVLEHATMDKVGDIKNIMSEEGRC